MRLGALEMAVVVVDEQRVAAAAGRVAAHVVHLETARLALAVGNEGAGLSSSIRENAKRLISLPVTGHVESLNVAVAAGILLYQLRK